MSTRRGGDDVPLITVRRLALPDFAISWAGNDPKSEGYCFGSEDGRICFVGLDGTPFGSPYDVAPSGEAISGAAFADDMMAVSTRQEVVFLNGPRLGEGIVEQAVFYGGAFDVVATPQGGFVAPMGRNGLLILGKKQEGAQKVTTLKAGVEGFNFYKVAPLARVPGGGDVIACAARNDGFAVMTVGDAHSRTAGRRLRCPGVDFVDACSLGSESHPLAAAALGLDKSIHLTYDALQDPSPKTLRFEGLRGRAYRIFCRRGHIILLTSEGLYALMDVATRYLNGDPIDAPTKSQWLGIQPVDAEMTSGGHLLAVMTDSVYSIDVDTLTAEDENRGATTRTGVATNHTGKISLDPEMSDESWEHFDEKMWEESGQLELAGVR